MNNRLSGLVKLLFTLRAPMSHIGESHGPDSYLATQQILSAEGEPTEVFVYSGNALRGMLRDYGAKYLLDNLSDEGIVQVPKDVFYLLWSGGAIGGKQKLDIDQARKIRKAIPHLAILGGGVGNQILPGKLNVDDCLPLCEETQHLLPANLRDENAVSWRVQTEERSYTRRDDAKDDNKLPYLSSGGEEEQLKLTGEAAKKKAEKENPQQMRYTVEVMQPGTRLYGEIAFFDLNEVELGALVAAFAEWSKRPVLGGKSSIGMGKVYLDAKLQFHGEEEEPFLQLSSETYMLGERAKKAKTAYDEYLGKYRQYLNENKEGLVALIGAQA